MTPFEFVADINNEPEVKTFILDDDGLVMIIKIKDNSLKSVSKLFSKIGEFCPTKLRFQEFKGNNLIFGLERNPKAQTEIYEYYGGSYWHKS